MTTLASSQTLRSSIGRFVLIALAGGALAACDGHSAAEVPDSYGHGSAHERSYKDHQTDSRLDSRHFSDSQGMVAEGEEGRGAAKPAASPAGTPGGHFF